MSDTFYCIGCGAPLQVMDTGGIRLARCVCAVINETRKRVRREMDFIRKLLEEE